MDAKEFISEFLEKGFSLSQISDSVCDGDLLGALDLTQCEAEEIHSLIKEMTKYKF